jgi:hypothetical protein
MIFFRKEQSRRGKLVIRTMAVAWVAFLAWGTLRAISEERYYNATGGGIATMVFIFLLILLFIKPRESKPPNIGHTKSQVTGVVREGDQFVLLYSSKDIVRITQIEEALRSRDIDCAVLDRHGSVMMPFVPNIEMRIMVPREDYEWSVYIMNELIDQ